MCTTRILAQSKMGFVNLCSHCGVFHLAFGTAILKLSEDDFFSICSQIDDDVQSNRSWVDPEVKSIQIFHPSQSGFSLVLTYVEYRQFRDMLLEAHLILTAYQLIRE